MTHAHFRQQLAETQAAVSHYLERAPRWPLAAQVVPQLVALEHWTRDARFPSRKQRARINLGLLAVREIEPTDDLELYQIAQGFHELQYALGKMPSNPLQAFIATLLERLA